MKIQTFTDNKEFRAEVLKGISELSNLVSVTLGPGGRTVLLEQESPRPPISTKDGVTVAKSFQGATSIQRVVAEAAREVCERTVRQVGDGTTTAIVLASAIVQAGQEWLVSQPKYSPQRLSRELKDIFNDVIKPQVLGLARPIRSLPVDEAQEAVYRVALVSANHDKEIAEAVTKAVRYVGDDGMIVAEEGTGADTHVEHSTGFPVNSGLSDLGGPAAAAFVNRKSYGDCSLTGSIVVMFDGEINDAQMLLPILDKIQNYQDGNGNTIRHPVIVVAHRFGDYVLRFMAQNFRSGKLSIVPVVTPRNGQSLGRQQFLYDLAAYVGGKVFDSQGQTLEDANVAMLGFVESVKLGQNDSVFITEPEAEAVNQRIDELKEQMNGASEFDKDKLRYRIGQLTGGVATIYAGGASALEAKERHARVVDAISAVRSAMDLGVVPGGGSTLLHVSRSLNNEGPGQIFVKALKQPFVKILTNAGIAANDEEALFNGNQVGRKSDADPFMVYDALKTEIVEFWSSGIFDPAKVTLSALENALSVAQLLMTLGGVVSIKVSEGEQQVKLMQEGLVKAINNGELE